MNLFAGKLDRRIRLQRPLQTPNAFGERVLSYVDEATVWAGYVPLKGNETFAKSDQHTNQQPTIFEIRYKENVGPQWRLIYNGKTYEIEDVGEIGSRVGLRLTAYARNVVSGPT